MTRRHRLLILVAVYFVALFQSGCVAPGNMGASATNLNFGGVPVGSSKSQIVTIMNSGGGPFTITNAAVSGKGFDITAPFLPLTLAVGQSAKFTMRFAPAAIGDTSGSVLITKTQISSPQLQSGSASTTPSITSQQETIAMTGAGVSATPSITTQPASQTVTAGQTAIFSVTSSGAAPLSYQWSKNGTAISGSTLSTYTTPATATADSGSQFTVVVNNLEGNATSNVANLTVTPSAVAPLQITTSLLPNAQAGIQFQANLTATGGVQPYHWSLASGTLPTGLSLNAVTGLLSGTTRLGGQFDFSVQVSDSFSPKPQTTMKSLTLSVLAFALQISSSVLPGGQVGIPFQATITGNGGATPYTWAVTGALPAGLSLNASSGAIAGTPTKAGAYSFTIVLTDSAGQTAQKTSSITIASAAQSLAISTTTLPQAVTGQAYLATLQATGGTPPYIWNVTTGQLPPGLRLTATSGQITGTPSSTGQFSFVAQVTDASSSKQTATRALALSGTGAPVSGTGIQPSGSCGPPNYCARMDLNNQAYPGTIPNVGNLIGANITVTPSDFNNPITRITDVKTAGGPTQGNVAGFSIDSGAEVNFMNKNDDRFIVTTGGGAYIPYIWNGSTKQATQIYASSFPSTNGFVFGGAASVFPFWSYTQPYIAYDVEWANGSNNAGIYSYDFTSTTTPPTRQLVVDLTTCVPSLAGLKTPGVNFTVSGDDQTFGVTTGTNSSTGNIYVITWNRTNGCSVWNTSAGTISGSYGSTGNTGISDKFWIHNGRISKDGNWMRVDIGQCTAGSCESPATDQENNLYLWKVGTLTVNIIRFSSGVATGGHQAMGYTHLVNQAVVNSSDPDTEMAIRPYSDISSVTDLLTGSYSNCTGSPCSNHSSWANDLPGDATPVFATNCIGQFAPLEAWDNEIIAYATDGSGDVHRFSHLYSSCNGSGFSANDAIGSVSQSGNWFAWSSDWDGTLGNIDSSSSSCTVGVNCRADVFIVKLQ